MVYDFIMSGALNRLFILFSITYIFNIFHNGMKKRKETEQPLFAGVRMIQQRQGKNFRTNKRAQLDTK